MNWRRREVLASALAGVGALALAGCASVPNAPATESALAREVVNVPAGPGRETQLSVWTPAEPRGLVLFSTGWGSWPERYGKVIDRLGGMGLAVVAPLHPDSVRSPGGGNLPPEQAFQGRIADVAAAAAYGQERFAGLPVLAIGHSFGSLMAMTAGGALAGLGPFRQPAVRGVIAFSTPGKIEGLVGADAYSGLEVPLLLLTGTADLVPDYVTDPADHLFPAQTSGADSYALVMQGAGHEFVDDDAFVERAWPVIDLFVQAYLFDIFTAGDVLEDWPATGEDQFIVRRAGG